MIINYSCKIVSFRSKIFKYLCRDLQAISTPHEIIHSRGHNRGFGLCPLEWGLHKGGVGNRNLRQIPVFPAITVAFPVRGI